MKKIILFIFVFALSACDLGGNDKENQPPVIEALDSYDVEAGDISFLLSEHIVITDNEDGLITFVESMIDYQNFDINILGEYDIQLLVKDSKNLSVRKTIVLNVVDTTPPIIALAGDSEVFLEFGIPYLEEGLIMSDNFDKTLNPTVVGEVDLTHSGQYILEYYVLDQTGNKSDSVYRTVNIESWGGEPYFNFLSFKYESNLSYGSFTFYDPDGVYYFDNVSIYKEGIFVKRQKDIGSFNFTGLFSNTMYQTVITYKVSPDKADDYEDAIKTAKHWFTTKQVSIPVYSASNVNIETNLLTLDLEVTDNGLSFISAKAVLYDGETLIEEKTIIVGTNILAFDATLLESEYQVKVESTYNLYDGQGVQVVDEEVLVIDRLKPLITSENRTSDNGEYTITVNEEFTEYSIDNGVTWESVPQGSSYTITDLEDGTYTIIVRDLSENFSSNSVEVVVESR